MGNATAGELVSIVIPAFNEERNIVNCLDSIKKQSYKKIEVVLVDDCSTDNTAIIAKNQLDELNLIRLKSHKERGFVRNLGAKQSKGDYLLFIDADMILNKKVIEECVAQIQTDPNMGGIIVPEESVGEGYWTKVRALEKKCYQGDDNIEAARFYGKKAFWRVGGWDEKMISGEDWDLTRRIRKNYEIGRISEKIFHNEGKLSIWKVIRKKFYYASNSQTYLRKYPMRLKDVIFFIFRPAYFRNWRLILSDPLHGLGLLFLKTIELAVGALGYLLSKLSNLP